MVVPTPRARKFSSWVPLPPIIGSGDIASRFTEVIELIVFISDTASALPAWAARAGWRISVILGVSFTITGLSIRSIRNGFGFIGIG